MQQHAFRQLRLAQGAADFCSNDYLGIVHNNVLHPLLQGQQLKTGSTGSRLLAGNYALAEAAEQQLAVFHAAPAALLFNSGYDANVGVLSSIPQRGDTILYDALSHASIRDGIRLSLAKSFSFAHNDMVQLEERLQKADGTIFVVTESVFSMDGDMCPLQQLVALCTAYNAHLIIDEAHATGVVGERGEGLVQHLGLQQQVFCRVHTFGKACGCHGAAVLGSVALRDYLVNFARSFIYTTSLPEHDVAVIQASYAVFPGMHRERTHLRMLIHTFQQAAMRYEKLVSHTPIQVVLVPGNDAVKQVAAELQQKGLDVRPILYPTVPLGKERLRIVLHAFNTAAELAVLLEVLG
ncbi:aminotransferase class I/II-fold pyridoxal phosphate-dependent enzyme [Deminuibacter soli]|nr:8-amino-7-oxononanoate synthase [Deminuibacter soli]